MKGIRTTAVIASALLLAACGGTALKAGSPPDTAKAGTSASSPSASATPSSRDVRAELDALWPSRDEAKVCDPATSQSEIAALVALVSDPSEAADAETIVTTYVDSACELRRLTPAVAAAEAQAKAAAAAKVAAAAKAKKALTSTKSYAQLSKRSMAKVIRDPDSYVGRKYVIYGEVTQYDSATGNDDFRANVAYKNTAAGNYGYFDGENAMITKGAANISDIVEDDIVKMYVTVVGSYSYDTQIGGNTSAPQFKVNIIKRVS